MVPVFEEELQDRVLNEPAVEVADEAIGMKVFWKLNSGSLFMPSVVLNKLKWGWLVLISSVEVIFSSVIKLRIHNHLVVFLYPIFMFCGVQCILYNGRV